MFHGEEFNMHAILKIDVAMEQTLSFPLPHAQNVKRKTALERFGPVIFSPHIFYYMYCNK